GVEHAVQRLGAFIHQVAGVSSPYAGFFTDDDCPGRLYYIGQLPVGNGHGASGEHQPGGPFGGDTLTAFYPLLQFVAQISYFGGESDGVIIERYLVDKEGVSA